MLVLALATFMQLAGKAAMQALHSIEILLTILLQLLYNAVSILHAGLKHASCKHRACKTYVKINKTVLKNLASAESSSLKLNKLRVLAVKCNAQALYIDSAGVIASGDI